MCTTLATSTSTETEASISSSTKVMSLVPKRGINCIALGSKQTVLRKLIPGFKQIELIKQNKITKKTIDSIVKLHAQSTANDTNLRGSDNIKLTSQSSKDLLQLINKQNMIEKNENEKDTYEEHIEFNTPVQINRKLTTISRLSLKLRKMLAAKLKPKIPVKVRTPPNLFELVQYKGYLLILSTLTY